MKVLHYNPQTESMVTQYVAMLVGAMVELKKEGANMENFVASSLSQFRQIMAAEHPDIVHLHGCWHSSLAVAEFIARKNEARVVVSPHGQLEPWVLHDRYFTYRLPRLIAYQRRIVSRAYAIIVMGNMEQRCVQKFTSNPRIEKVMNALITQKISEKMMARKVTEVYQKVLDSDTLGIMDENTYSVLSSLIKIGITGDSRWIDSERLKAVWAMSRTVAGKDNASSGWRQIFVYAYYEGIMPVILKGMGVVGIKEVPDFKVELIPCYLPKNYKPSVSVMPDVQDVNEQVVAYVKALSREASRNRLTISGLLELQRLLYDNEVNEDKLLLRLKESELETFAARLMQIMEEKTLLDEGYMIIAPLNDRKTKHLIKKIENRLKIQ